MKYGVLSDVHANYPALSAVVSDSKSEVDSYIFLGDMIGLMGFPEETTNKLKDISKYALKGNHDISVVEREEGHVNSPELSEFELRITQEQLSDNNADWISSLNSFQEVDSIVLSHAKPFPEMSTGLEPRNPGLGKGSFTKAAANYDDEVVDFIMVGHTHDQGALDCSKFGNDIVVLNPGTVGMNTPYSTAEYAVIDTTKQSYDLRTVDYDFKEVESRLYELNVPIKWW